ncbi:MAG: class I SAM-dependent methyltransferase [Candidatus Paceibacterota bacterium]|jgi:SAM-dependent methyltransferase
MDNNSFDKIEFETVDCPFCRDEQELKNLFSAPDRLNNLPGEFYVVKCQRCGLVFQNPRPKEKWIELYYPDNAGYFVPSDVRMGKLKKRIDELILINFFGYKNLGSKNLAIKILLFLVFVYFYRSKSIPRYVENGKLLEIGCSHGAKLEYLKELGWEVKGIEFNKKAAQYAKEKRGLNVLAGSFFEVDLSQGHFDVVIMDMVLEHLYCPKEAIKKVFEILKPGGQLIFSIPYFNGLEYKLFKNFSYGLQLPAHIFFLNKENVADLLKGMFINTKIIFQHFDRDVVASAFYKHKEKGGFWLKIVSQNKIVRWVFIKPSVFIMSLFGLTSRITVKTNKIR